MDDRLPEIRKELKIAGKGVWWSGCKNRERKRHTSFLLDFFDIGAPRIRPIENILHGCSLSHFPPFNKKKLDIKNSKKTKKKTVSVKTRIDAEKRYEVQELKERGNFTVSAPSKKYFHPIMKLLKHVGNGRFWPLPVFETEKLIIADMSQFLTTCIIFTKRTIGKGESERSSIEFAAYKMLKYLEEHPIEDLLSMYVSTVDEPKNNLLSIQIGMNDANQVTPDSASLLRTLCFDRNWSMPKFKTNRKASQHCVSRCVVFKHVVYCKGESHEISRQQAANRMFQCLQGKPKN